MRAAVPTGVDDLFLAGDAHQRIYAHRVSLREVGIRVVGRSARLTVNYRTTAEILGWSLGMLRGERIDDLDGGLDSIAGYRSTLRGMPPTLRGYSTGNEELAALGAQVRQWLDAGIEAAEIGIAARSNALVTAALGRLAADGLAAHSLNSSSSDEPVRGVAVGTMHRMKGLEFRALAVFG
ncbi:MAG: UvrD-helicase domain-containing protein, partial [Sciscionella sp.]